MIYKVVPFTASIEQKQSAAEAAAQLEALIMQMATAGFEYVSLERVETFVQGTEGCFGIGAKESITLSLSMAVFRR